MLLLLFSNQLIYSHVILCQFASDSISVSSVFRDLYRVGKLVYQADKIFSSGWWISWWIINEFEKHGIYNCFIKYSMFRYIASSFKIHISHCQFSIVVCLMAGSSLMTPVSICLFPVAAVWAQTCHTCHTVKHGESSPIPLNIFPSILPSNTSSNIPPWRII